MWGAYLFQLTNLVAAMLIVPVLLLRLGADEYALWLLFASIMGAATQVQNGIQGVAVKQIAIGFHRGDREDFICEIGRAKRHYRIFAGTVLGPVLILTTLYFHVTQNISNENIVAWLILIVSYAISYIYTPNNAILMATDRVGLNGTINTASRVIFFFLTVSIIYFYQSLIAPCVALSVAVVVGAGLNTIYARRQVARFFPDRTSFPIPAYSGNIRKYTAFTFSSFMLYTGSLTIIAPLFPDRTASYGLALQMSALTVTMSMVPAQVWLARLVRSDHHGAQRELRLTLMVCNGLFLLGYGSIVALAPIMLKLIGADITLPGSGVLLLMGTAFLVELNIAVLANHLTANADYSFAVRYAIVAAATLTAGTFIAALSGLVWLGFLVVPTLVQAVYTLPFMVLKVLKLKTFPPV